MKWTAAIIGHAVAKHFFRCEHLALVPTCGWTGNECDLLVVTKNFRIIDVEIKISRADFRADANKHKWYQKPWPEVPGRERRRWPRKVWKHYFVMPEEIWRDEMIAELPSDTCGVVLMRRQRNGFVKPILLRRAKPCRDAERLSPEQVLDIARAATLRLWDALVKVEALKSNG